jgi:membrane protein DedA with SNARE-associated domain
MKRALGAAVAMWLGLRLHHHFHGPPFDYAGLAAACAASWIGVPGPGETLLIAAGIFAAKHRLDIGEVLLIAAVSATAGGTAGWQIGMRAGRVVLTAKGPLQRARCRAVERGDQVFARVPVLAVLLTPSWVAGIHRVRPRIFLALNTGSAILWACGFGLGAYFAGPPVLEVASDIGWASVAGLIALVLAGVLLELRRRRRHATRPAGAGSTDADPEVEPARERSAGGRPQ